MDMSVSNWLENPDSFKKMLAALISDQGDKWENLRRDISLDEPVLQQFAATQWAQRRLPDNPDILAIATLYIAYQFRWLLVDSVRLVDPIDGYLQDELNVTLLLPLYIWPAYNIWVLQEFPAKARLNQNQAIPWLLNQQLRLQAFRELDIPEPNEKYLAFIEVKKNTTNLSRWVQAGCESLHFVMHLATKNTPPSLITVRTNTLQELDEKSDEILVSNRNTPDAGISRLANLHEPDLVGDVGKPEYWYLNSPIFQPYLQWKEASETYLELRGSGYKSPSLCQIARKILDQRITTADLDLHQQAQSYELLSELVDWIGLEKAPDASISLKSIEARWRQFHKSDISPLIKTLLETNLLQITGQDGRVCVAQPLIRDYLQSMAQVKQLHSTNPIPHRGIALTTWIYWIVCQWFDCGDLDRAGKTPWNAAGTLPGLNSGAWVQIALILAHLPEELLREPHIWLLTSLVRKVFRYRHDSLLGAQGWLFENADFPIDTSFSVDIQQSKFTRILEEYREGLMRYHSVVSHNAKCILEMALGFDPSSRSDLWIRKHAFSALKTFNPEKEVEIRILPFVYQPKQLYEIILDFAMKENNWELKLAACESLIPWGVQETKAILEESRITELPDEYYHRSKILRYALEGKPEYANWI
jgi:hypothetical protein